MRVLCLDIEGGYGGSSRSLYESVRYLPGDMELEVWCRRTGPIQARYEALGVSCRVTPDMPHISSLPRPTRNLYVYGRFALGWPKSRGFRSELVRAVRERFDLIHFNHEGLVLLASWLKPRTRVPLTMHIRTNLRDTLFARWQNRKIAATMDHLVYITKNERNTFERLSGRRPMGTVIHNIVAPSNAVEPYDDLDGAASLKIACLSNYQWIRGVDRLIPVAEALARRGRRDVRFVVAGDMSLTRSLPGELGVVARRGGTLADYAARRGVSDMFRFLGHVDAPERVLAACDMLAKPSRERNPWGRDVLEALSMGCPVLSVGDDSTFVEDGVTGVLQAEFDADALATAIIQLAADPDRRAALGEAGRKRVRSLCDGPARAADLAAVWRALAERSPNANRTAEWQRAG